MPSRVPRRDRAHLTEPAAGASEEQLAIADDVGHAWVAELVAMFRSTERDIVGAWPGTLSEARMRILARTQRTMHLGLLDGLARVALGAARRQWQVVADPDPET